VDEDVGVKKSDVPRLFSIPRILGRNLPEEADVAGSDDAAEVPMRGRQKQNQNKKHWRRFSAEKQEHGEAGTAKQGT
jgi:hypothetical protein